MRKYRALGLSGGAGGIEYRRGLVFPRAASHPGSVRVTALRANLAAASRSRAAATPAYQTVKFARLSAAVDNFDRIGKAGGFIPEFGRRDEDFCFAVGEDVLYFRGGQKSIKGHGGGAGLDYSEVRDYEFGRVVKQQRGGIAPFNSKGFKGSGECGGKGIQFAVRNFPPLKRKRRPGRVLSRG